MENDKLQNLLSRFDEEAPSAGAVSGDLAGVVRRRAGRQRRTRKIIAKTAAVAVIVGFVCVWAITAVDNKAESQKIIAGAGQSQESIAQLEVEVAQLNAKVDSLLDMLAESRGNHQKEKQLVLLEDELSAIPDPIEEMQRNIDKVVIGQLYRAGQIENKYLAADAYKRIIKLFPDNYYTDMAKEKLSEIDDDRDRRPYWHDGDKIHWNNGIL